MSTVTTRLYGTCSSEFWTEFVAKDPYGFHVTRKVNARAIATGGLMPGDVTGQGAPNGAEPARRDTVYLGGRDLLVEGWLHTWTDIARVDSAIVVCDLRALELACILPDEDAWIESMAGEDPSVLGLAPYDSSLYPSGGEWAEAVMLGAQPGSVELSITDRGRYCVLGGVAPTHLVVLGADDPLPTA